jgi:hypothetical protein
MGAFEMVLVLRQIANSLIELSKRALDESPATRNFPEWWASTLTFG